MKTKKTIIEVKEIISDSGATWWEVKHQGKPTKRMVIEVINYLLPLLGIKSIEIEEK